MWTSYPVQHWVVVHVCVSDCSGYVHLLHGSHIQRACTWCALDGAGHIPKECPHGTAGQTAQEWRCWTSLALGAVSRGGGGAAAQRLRRELSAADGSGAADKLYLVAMCRQSTLQLTAVKL
jgi:hypothetical protein